MDYHKWCDACGIFDTNESRRWYDLARDDMTTALAAARQEEREACAKEGDTIEAGFPPPRSYEQAHYLMGVQALQAAIRARRP